MSDHTYASAITTSLKRHKRKAADFYPTPFDVTEALLRFLQLENPQYIWEPACGDGAMAKMIEIHSYEVWATDIRENCWPGRGSQWDFLSEQEIYGHHPDWIITNPPFNVAEDFIRKALSITPNVAMLLKSTYWHAKRRRALFEEHPPAFVLPLTWRPAFLEAERGSSPLMDVVWVVWREGAGEQGTIYQPLERPVGFRLPDLNDDLDYLLGDLLGTTQTDDILGDL